jgi:hypothetical protein
LHLLLQLLHGFVGRFCLGVILCQFVFDSLQIANFADRRLSLRLLERDDRLEFCGLDL